MVRLTKHPVLLVDADTILYRCGFAAERMFYLLERPDGAFKKYGTHKEAKGMADEGDYIWSRREFQPVENALSNVNKMIDAIEHKYKPYVSSYFLTGKGNFRDFIAKTKDYKGNRDPASRPKHYQAIRKYLVDDKRAQVINGYEADDAIGASAYSLKEGGYVIISNDKDLDQVPGHHYDWTTGNEWYISPEDAMKVFYTQLLSGDPVDNIPGIMSDKKAAELIRGCVSPKQAADVVIEAYINKFKDTEIFPNPSIDRIREVANLVWIKRSLDPKAKGFLPPIEEYLFGPQEAL